MTQVQELASQGLKREFKITVESSEIEKNLEERLVQIGKTVKLDGFRPGKVPMPVLRKRYGEAARGEVIEKTVNETADKLISERSLRPAMRPKIEIEDIDASKPLVYTMAFEVLPEVKLTDGKKISLEKLTVSVPDSEVETMLTRMAKGARGPESLAEPRPAQTGDVLLIDFEGSSEGKPHPGMAGKNHRLELGSKSFIEGFEEQLAGRSKGDEVTVKVTFPAAYHAAELAGKPAEFKVTVKDIMAHAPLTLDDELAKEIGFDSIDALRSKIRERMQADYGQMTRDIMKRQLLDSLADIYDFAVPESMVEAEFKAIWSQLEEERERGTVAAEDAAKSDEELKAEYQEIAERRVRLGLVLSEVGKQQNIKIEPTELREALIAETRNYPGQEKQVFDYFTNTPGALDRLRAPLLEDKAVDYMISQASVTEKQVTPEELRAAPDKLDEKKPKKGKKKVA